MPRMARRRRRRRTISKAIFYRFYGKYVFGMAKWPYDCARIDAESDENFKIIFVLGKKQTRSCETRESVRT